MGTSSYVLTGTDEGMQATFGTTCHGAVSVLKSIKPLVSYRIIRSLQGRALSRAKSRRNLDFQDVLDKLAQQGISIRVASPKLVMEEVSPFDWLISYAYHLYLFWFQAPESYKNVDDVVDTCHEAGISKKCIRLRPIAVIKG